VTSRGRLARCVHAALASFALSAAALAGTVEGSVTFPSQFVPSMTVYAASVDDSRVYSVRLRRGQTNFMVKLPPGRYLVFLAPNEPGAPDIYGAYTQYSLCAARDGNAKCEDHALVPVAVTAKAPHAAVSIDDWYLTDDVAGQIDHIRGVLADGGARFDSEVSSAPRFSEYPSAAFDASEMPRVDFGGGGLPEEDRADVQRALLGGPNFAGHVTATLTHCGPGCGRLVLIDWQTGAILALPPPHEEMQSTLPCRPEEALQFRRDSRLLSVSRMRGTAVVTEYYVWNQKNAALLPGGEYRRPAAAFCAVAAR
jgi:hypothetical protein